MLRDAAGGSVPGLLRGPARPRDPAAGGIPCRRPDTGGDGDAARQDEAGGITAWIAARGPGDPGHGRAPHREGRQAAGTVREDGDPAAGPDRRAGPGRTRWPLSRGGGRGGAARVSRGRAGPAAVSWPATGRRSAAPSAATGPACSCCPPRRPVSAGPADRARRTGDPRQDERGPGNRPHAAGTERAVPPRRPGPDRRRTAHATRLRRPVCEKRRAHYVLTVKGTSRLLAALDGLCWAGAPPARHQGQGTRPPRDPRHLVMDAPER